MQSVNEIMSVPPRISPYTGSSVTYDLVAKQIEKRWGHEEVKKYDPYNNALTFAQWWKLGYRVKKGEKAIRSITFVEVKDPVGNIIKKIKRGVCLFYCKQVEKRKL
ncbi:MAG: hypothetical protein UV53_C0006G0013 [Candidatus Azambacteria bacterium GW2011_GWE1_42_9]|nr:MAG: hypothetical protein UV45_C0001G0008 [Candidatus Azambacteria bacterium GW2011_GWB1_42_72]KKS79470.1 MAG: hypothetical protein UV53_C0006G0013 [Candidatus Azambacteria bacterium GW2011_GWE1_42_9]KKT03077.1 MAG: hypothetical protein UV81_C0004G0014 [Candidatus Azambacteria bacterium GW2011_GWD1_43_18]KKT17090.1 MAG: hypothetical protein UV99_C0001G0026 [Parcubacteria group bacterium GW2011_GWC1_43_61]OGD40961.1 MAG: hypothetical protein A3K28_00125 [Candidatus Azambacteria bacterium RIFO